MIIDEGLAGQLVAEVNARTGAALRLEGVAEFGDSGGAAYVRWPDGRPGVLTRSYTSVERMLLTADVLYSARSRGVPAPRHELVLGLADGSVAVVQERLPGIPVDHVDVDVIKAMVEMNERFAGLLADRPDVPTLQLHLRHSGDEFPRHELLEEYSDRTRRLLRRIREIGNAGPDALSGCDLVHPDYARGNVLGDAEGKITGVIDWNLGAVRGDRRFALVWLRSDLEWRVLSADPETIADDATVAMLDDVIISTVDPALLPTYWAYWTLLRLHGTILGGSHEATEVFLSLGEHRLL